jgi:type II secretory pathway component PulK
MKTRGAALIVVLWIVAVLAVVCVALGSSLQFRQASVRRNRSDIRDTQAMLSALAAARAVLLADPRAADGLDDAWAVDDDSRFDFEIADQQVQLYVPAGGGSRTGLADEAARINVNVADAETMGQLPGMTLAAGESLAAIVDHSSTAGPEGDSGGLSTEAELLAALEKAISTSGLQYSEPADDAFWPARANVSAAAREAARHMTLYTKQRNVDAAGRPRVNLNEASPDELATALGEHLDAQQIEALVRARQERPFATIGELLTRELSVPGEDEEPVKVEISVATFRQIADHVTTSDREILVGRVNVNTAPVEVLRVLPGLNATDAAAIVEARNARADQASLGWLLDVLTPETFAECCGYLTTRSQQFRMYAQTSGDAAPSRRCLAVLERTAEACIVLSYTRWQSSSSEPAR